MRVVVTASGERSGSAREALVSELVARAEAAAVAGGVLVKDRPQVLTVDSKSCATDVVTQMDRRCEELLVSMLLDGRPDDAVLGEEGADRVGTSGVRWVIDPIDGTVNYLYGLPYWAVCVGIELDGEPVAGVVHLPEFGETYVAWAGHGAWLRVAGGERQLQVNQVQDMSLALVATGFGYSVSRRESQAAVVRHVVPKVRDIRRQGSAAVDLCWLAAGRVDAYYERGLHPWDLCAAGVVAREAGAVVGGQNGAPPGEDLVIAANPVLFAQLDALLTGLNAAGDGTD
ncbi:MAG: inositol monophosphatase family protein [Actinomycetes bacterium]